MLTLHQIYIIKATPGPHPRLNENVFHTRTVLAHGKAIYFVSETPIMPIIFHQSKNVLRCFW